MAIKHPEDSLFRVSLYHSDDDFDCTHSFVFASEAVADEFIAEYSKRARKAFSKKLAEQYIANMVKNPITPREHVADVPESLWEEIFSK
jgi:hypothetical protein